MPKSALEKELEKQRQEQKRFADNQKKMAEKQVREERELARKREIDSQAQSIVNNAKNVNGFIVIDGESEQFLRIILEKIEQVIQKGESPQSQIAIRVDALPEYLQRSFSFQLKKLEHYGMISGVVNFTYMAHLTVTPEGLNYFAEKEKAMSTPMALNPHRKTYDVFISHANSDKEEYVDKLYTTVKKLGINVFYDKEVLAWGDNWKQVILDGTADSEFAIIVISQNFFNREWTEKELNEFLNQQNEGGQKVVLPLLYGITRQDLIVHYPELADIQYISTDDYSKEEIAILLAKELIKRYK